MPTLQQTALSVSPPAACALPRIRWFHWLLLLVIFASGAYVRFHGLLRLSQWTDEFWSVYDATGRGDEIFSFPGGTVLDPPPREMLKGAPSWPHVWTGMGRLTHPPLYFIALRWWMDVFGDGDFSTRSFSVVASLLGVLVIFDAVRRQSGNGPALVAAFFMALAVSQIFYSQETRSYTLQSLEGLIACDIMIRIEQGGATRLRLLALGAAVLSLAWTHYFCAGAVLGLGVYSLMALRGSDRRKTAWTIAAVAIIALLIWFPWLLQQRPQFSDQGQWATDKSPSRWAPFVRAAYLPMTYFYGRIQAINIMGRNYFWPAYVPFAVLVYVVPLVLIRRKPQMLLWWSVVSGTIAVVLVNDIVHHTWLMILQRYTVMCGPEVFALAATPITFRISSRLMRGLVPWIIPAMLMVGQLSFTTAYIYEGPEPNADWRDFARQMDRRTGPRDLLVFYPDPFLKSAAFYYMAFDHYVRDSRRPIMMLYGPASDRARKILARYPFIWLVGPDPAKDVSRLLPGWTPTSSRYGNPFIGEITKLIRPQPATRPR